MLPLLWPSPSASHPLSVAYANNEDYIVYAYLSLPQTMSLEILCCTPCPHFILNKNNALIMALYRTPPGAVTHTASTENIEEPSCVLFPFVPEFYT